jgi:hypothetical protein
MASHAVKAHGTLLQMSDNAGGWITVSEQTQVDLTLTRDEVDISIHNEPLDARNYLAGPMSGEVALTCNWIGDLTQGPGGTGLLELFTSGTKWLFRVLYQTLVPVRMLTFTGFPREMNIPAPAGTAAAIQFSTTVRIDGPPTWS